MMIVVNRSMVTAKHMSKVTEKSAGMAVSQSQDLSDTEPALAATAVVSACMTARVTAVVTTATMAHAAAAMSSSSAPRKMHFPTSKT